MKVKCPVPFVTGEVPPNVPWRYWSAITWKRRRGRDTLLGGARARRLGVIDEGTAQGSCPTTATTQPFVEGGGAWREVHGVLEPKRLKAVTIRLVGWSACAPTWSPKIGAFSRGGHGFSGGLIGKES